MISNKLLKHSARRFVNQVTTRNIAVGTDLTSGAASWQKARPWHMDDNNSNLAKDNEVTMTDIFKNKKVVVFGVPAPFTGTCTHAHYPPYKKLEQEFKSKGVDEVVCYSVADPYSHYNWGKALNNDFDKITFLADDTCEWAKDHGLDRDYTGSSLGHRSARFSMFVDDGVVKSFNMVEEADKDAETLLGQV
eukprot:CAMPEP_0203649384 /NCGR_PEP_ID=MMETSP0088-20131115/21685_1 /ASSEMBLY_ACC=CAM_ASM_001087 /TAXON_ID=426623 /ORGANISM="Chaetoceros affinis, Strain CCMP159" /LENGTH=190 /DNA_ID=CAMNT_0050507779 /DNA_START=44 /DNA_END=616 /DNA_ORIENTATION=+